MDFKVYYHFWINEEDPKIAKICPNPEWKHPLATGQWMMFFQTNEIDEKWKQAVNLYRSGKLIGVHAMRVSTMRENFRKSDNFFHVIFYFCGPSEDKDFMIKIGQNLLKNIQYKNLYGAMFYTDVQAFLGSEDKVQGKYKIDVPKC